MKNSIKILTLSLALSSAASNAVPFMPEFGVKGGVGITNMSVSGTSTDYSSSFGYMLGGAGAVNLGLVGLDLDILYARRSWDAGASAVHSNQLYIPLQLDYGVGPALLTAGGYYSTILGNVTVAGASMTPAAAYLNSSDMGIVLGVGAKLFGFSAELRYNWGLKNLSTVTGTTAKARHIDLLVGYWFF